MMDVQSPGAHVWHETRKGASRALQVHPSGLASGLDSWRSTTVCSPTLSWGRWGGGVLAGLLPEAARDKPGPLLSLGSFTELSVAADPFLTTCYRGSLPRNDRLCIRFGTGGWPHLVGFCFTHSRLAPTRTTRDLLTPYQHESKRAEAVRTRVPRVPAGAPISPSLSPE